MKNLLRKELRLSASPLTWFFLLFAAMTMIPGYPILMGAFFICLGMFYSFQSLRENNDILYSILLPTRKGDTVRAKYFFCCFTELLAFLLMTVLTVLRMTVLKDVPAYNNNVMMAANPLFLAFVLVIFLLFNLLFLGGFFRTADKVGRPFVHFVIATVIIIVIAEALHHIPGLEILNSVTGWELGIQFGLLSVALICYVLLTMFSCRRAMEKFEKLDF